MSRRRRSTSVERAAIAAPEGQATNGRSPRWTHVVALSVFFLLFAILFRDVLLTETIYGGDLDLEFRGNRAYGFGMLAKGELPLWNPYQFCGYPFVASLQSAIFYPPNLLFLILDLPAAFAWSILLHLALAGVFAYIIVSLEAGSALGALMAAQIAALSPTLISRVWAGHITLINGYPWLLLTIAALHRASPDRWRRCAAAAGVALSLQILAGHPAIPALGVFFTAVYALTVAIAPSLRPRRVAVLRTAIVGAVLGVALAGVQVVPTASYLATSARRGGVSYEFATGGSFPPEGLALMIAPGFFGRTPDGDYWGRWFEWEFMPFIGIAALLLVLCARRSSSEAALVVCLIATFALSFGKHGELYPLLFKWLPGFSLLRGPGRMFLLAVPVAAVCAGSALSRAAVWADLRPLVRAATALSLVIGAIWFAIRIEPETWDSPAWKRTTALVMATDDHYEEIVNLPDNAFFFRSYGNATRALGGAVIVASIVAAGVKSLRSRPPVFRRGLVVLVASFELVLASRPYVAAAPSSPARFPEELVKLLRASGLGFGRIASGPETSDYDRGALDGLPHVGGYDPALPSRYVEYANTLFGRSVESELVVSEPFIPAPMLRLMGVTHVLLRKGRPPLPESTLVGSVDRRDVYRLTSTLPRTFFVAQTRIAPTSAERLGALADTDLHRVALVEEPIPLEGSVGSVGASEMVSYQPHEVVVDCDAETQGLLVLTDTFDPWWRAQVDGVRARIYPVDHLFRGVVVPAGKHRVTFEYSTQPVVVGLLLSGGGFLGFAGLLWARRPRMNHAIDRVAPDP